MKIAVIVSDAVGAMHAGLDVERTVRAFDMPEEMENYIKGRVQPYVTVTFALVDEKKDTTS